MELVISKGVSITNPDLKKATNSIKGYASNIRKNYLRIASKLAEVDAQESYIEDGFGDVIEYATSVFNMKKTTAYNLLKIGREYVDEDTPDKTILADNRGDYSVSQLGVLLPVGVDKVVELNNDGVISPEMSVRKLASIVSSSEDENTEETNDGEGAGGNEENPENEPTQTITLWVNGDITFSGFDKCDENALTELSEEIQKVVDKYL